MGLYFCPGNASWSYGGFHEFRVKLAQTAGIDLLKMEGYEDNPHICGMSWDTTHHPLKDLLEHSDCDGHLTPKQLRVILPALKVAIESPKFTECEKKEGAKLIAGMEEAIAKNRKLWFR